MRLPMLSVVLFSLLAVAVSGAAPQQTADGLLLFDFEQPADLQLWQVRDLTGLALTNAWAAHGRSAAAITYHAWETGKEQWPAIIAAGEKGALPALDLSPFEVLCFTAYNPQDRPVEVKVHISGRTPSRFSNLYSLPAKRATTISIPVKEITGSVGAAEISQLHFYVTRPESTYTIYLDDVRLSFALPERVAALQSLAAATSARLAPAALLGNLPADLWRLVSSLPRLSSQAGSLAREVAAGQITSYQAASAAVKRISNQSRRLTALQGAASRVLAYEYAARTGAKGFVLATESPMQKVFLEAARFAGTYQPSYRLYAARNEHESVQVVVVPVAGDLSDVKWELSAPRNAAGRTVPATVRLVGYVDCKKPVYATPGEGWYPDPLLDMVPQVAAVPAGEVLPLWVTVEVPADAAAGDYRGKLTVTAAGKEPHSVALDLTVWDFALPQHSSLRTALDWRTPSAKLYPADQAAAMQRKYEDWMLREYHLNPGKIYGQPPWDAARVRELRGLGLNAINLAYISAPEGRDFKPEEFARKLEQQMAQIEAYLKVLDEAGARDLAYIYCFDERPSAELGVVFDTAEKLHRRFPGIPVMTTAYDNEFGLSRANGAAMDIWVPLTPKFDGNAERIARAQEAGRSIWWYICIGPQHPYANWFVEYPVIEARLLMGAMTARYRPGGFLYYAVNRWPLNDKVITGGPRTDWNPASYQINNGDGSIMCAGPDGPLATIRLENIRDGLEDYEYYTLLRQLLAQGKRPAAAGEVSPTVVKDLTHFTHDPQVLGSERERVAREILKLSAK